MNCRALFSNPDIDASSEFSEPPYKIPKWLVPEFNYGGKVKLGHYYMDDTNYEHAGNVMFPNGLWSKKLTDHINGTMTNGTFEGPSGRHTSEKINEILKTKLMVKGKHVLVIGSQTPWLEILALRNGARRVTSVDYMNITNENP